MCWPARLTTASQAGRPFAARSRHVMRPGPPVREISVTRSPRARNAADRAEPMKPLPPPITTCAAGRMFTSPMPLATVPGVEQIGEAVVDEARDLAQHRQSQHARQPAVAGRATPDLDGAI